MTPIQVALSTLALVVYTAFAAPDNGTPPPPAHVQHSEVIVSPPPATAPVLNVVVPTDESTKGLVTATWLLFWATVGLCLSTFVVGRWQSGDVWQRDRAVIEREIRRGAQKNQSVSIWLNHVALEIPNLAKRISRLATASTEVPEELLWDVESTLQRRQKRLGEILNHSIEVLSKYALDFEHVSDKAAQTLVRTIDLNDVELQSMREEILNDRDRYDREISALLDNLTAMRAAELARGAGTTAHLKTKLGE
jgi:hypothetical protein